jgi:hypothetical protein
MTLAEILAKYSVGSDERLNALAEWRRLEDERLGAIPRPVKVPTGKRVGRPPLVPAVAATIVHPNTELARSAWSDRKQAADAQREAEAAAAIKARLKRAVDLTQARLGAIADPKDRMSKMARLSELQASLSSNNPKTLAIIGKGFLDIEAKLARLNGE